MTSEDRNETKNKKRKDENLARNSKGKLHYKNQNTDIAHLLQQLKLYCS
jgi:hypothetical protein